MRKVISILLIVCCCCFAAQVSAQDSLKLNKTLAITVAHEGSAIQVPDGKVWKVASTGDKEALFIITDNTTQYIIHNNSVATNRKPKVALPLTLPMGFVGRVSYEGNPKKAELIIKEYDIIK